MKPTLLFALLAGLILAACGPQPAPLQLTLDERKTIEAYLVQEVGLSSFGGQAFCPF